ncbi:hypothetical protein BS47DRAFT_1133883 [Hydnum rufescens UP504]|uniref:Uncharacterized protein n=1 Tax=Hydnum rufescens UP504 TaxID=1448309 RepID=A0A9P6AUT8_9AGAM|nr:hypothetical protein BS47DRAFT_1133883 [Hydnum rufescens UP504]
MGEGLSVGVPPSFNKLLTPGPRARIRQRTNPTETPGHEPLDTLRSPEVMPSPPSLLFGNIHMHPQARSAGSDGSDVSSASSYALMEFEMICFHWVCALRNAIEVDALLSSPETRILNISGA